jgi:hypothetical protein
VLVVVVDRDAAHWHETLKTVHRDLFNLHKTDPLAPVQLEVIDRATDEAIQRLIGAGLLSKTTRATRPLSSGDNDEEAVPLTAEEQAKSLAHRDRAARKLKMARVLGNTGFSEEARPALLDAIHALGSAFAVERRLPEPAELQDALQPPLSHCWAGALPLLKNFVQDPAANWKPVAEQMIHLATVSR